MNTIPATLSYLNGSSRDEFVEVCGPCFEDSPWVAERTWDRRPFASRDDLHQALCQSVTEASEDEQLALIRAHPDLVGELARLGRLNAASRAEQAVAGLTTLTAAEVSAFDRYNREYHQRFGFPFVICARENKKEAILAAFPRRLLNTPSQEIKGALVEIAKIARLRLCDRVASESRGDLSVPHLVDQFYGKSAVRVTKVVRRGDRHDLWEFAVEILLRGDFDDCYAEGDNSRVIPTDTMKNSVYALARQHEFDSPEMFGEILAQHYLENFDQVSSATIEMTMTLWDRILVAGREHDHAFVRRQLGGRIARVVGHRHEPLRVAGGIAGLEVLKTTRSGFSGFPRDRYTTLQDTDDRILASTVNAEWDYRSGFHEYGHAYDAALASLLKTFAEHHSLAVQQTIQAIGTAILDLVPEIERVRLTMPNQHRLLCNLAPFGLENLNEVFVTTSEPFGLIHGTIARGDDERTT